MEVGTSSAGLVIERWFRKLTKGIHSVQFGFRDLEKVDLDTGELAAPMAETAMRASMLGALDAETEAEDDTTITPSNFKVVRRPFTLRPFQDAIDAFNARRVVSREDFDRMAAESKARAFTVSGATLQSMRQAIKDELAVSIAEGDDLRKFKRKLRERMELRGWLKPGPAREVPTRPGRPWHVETIFRNGTMASYARGRQKQMLQPAVMTARPFWEIVTVPDNRRRKTHKDAHGKVLAVSDPFWRSTGTPPWGHNCRCRVVTRSPKQAAAKGVSSGSSITGLPDPGFTGQRVTLPAPPVAPGAQPAPPPPKPPAPPPEAVPIDIAPTPPTGRSIAQPSDANLDPTIRDALEHLDFANKGPGQAVAATDLGLVSKVSKADKAAIGKVRKGRSLEDLAFGFDPAAPVRHPIKEVDLSSVVFPKNLNANEVADGIRARDFGFGGRPGDAGNADEVARALGIRDATRARAIEVDGRFHLVGDEDAIKAAAEALVRGGEGKIALRVAQGGARVAKAFPSRTVARQALADASQAVKVRSFQGAEATKMRLALRDLLQTEGMHSRDAAQLTKAADVWLVKNPRRGATASHSWDGKITIKAKEFRKAKEAFRKLAAGEEVTAAELSAASTSIHESIHGASRSLPGAYEGAGVGMEEAATEILARRVTRKLAGLGEVPPNHALGLPDKTWTTGREYWEAINRGEAPVGESVVRRGQRHRTPLRAYDGFISRFLNATRGAGYSNAQVESVLLKTRGPGGRSWAGAADQAEDFASELAKVTPADVSKAAGTNPAARARQLSESLRGARLDRDFF